MPLHAKAWQQACTAVGLSVSRQEVYQWEGEPGTVTARRLLTRAGVPQSRRVMAALLADKERRFQHLARRITVNPHLKRLLRTLSRRGVPIALVTGTSWKEVRRVVPRTVLAACTVVVTGDRVRRGKPHPEPYRRAVRELGIRPRQALVVENAPYGIQAARAAGAGWVVALASSLPRRFLRQAHHIVGTIPALCRRLSELLIDSRVR